MLAALALVPALLACEPRRITVPYTTTVDRATVVCIGTVDALQTVEIPPGVSAGQPATAVFGHVKVERVLKGPADLREFWHEGWSGLSEDMTEPGLHVRGLMLMGPPSMDRWAPAELRDRIRSELHTQLVMRNVGSGDGLIAIRNNGVGDYVEKYTLPLALRAPEETYPKGATRLSDVLEYTETLLRYSGEAITIHARSSELGDGASFDLRVLRDGSYRLAAHVDGFDSLKETVNLGRWEEPAWAELRAAEEQILAGSSVSLDRGTSAWASRSLRITFERSRLVFSNAGFEPKDLEGDEAKTYRLALRCWAEVRAAIPNPGLADHRERDRIWLEKH